MNGSDFKDFAFQAVANGTRVVFLDRFGNYHEIASAKRFRSKDTCGDIAVLLEDGVMVQSFGELRLEKPPKGLLDYLNNKWKEQGEL